MDIGVKVRNYYINMYVYVSIYVFIFKYKIFLFYCLLVLYKIFFKFMKYMYLNMGKFI